MKRKFVLAKLHHAVVTGRDSEYIGSMTIDQDLLEASGIRPGEAVSAFDIDNAARFDTYVMKGRRGSGEVTINGASAHLVSQGDRLIVVAFAYLEDKDINTHTAKVILLNEQNRIIRQFNLDTVLE